MDRPVVAVVGAAEEQDEACTEEAAVMEAEEDAELVVHMVRPTEPSSAISSEAVPVPVHLTATKALSKRLRLPSRFLSNQNPMV